ncbi:hypothetical protein EWM64_g5415 [Hericium alpestre]|uniref:MYND-type domain-containing protein n=1 Tax=Hericium alpestre TaxID=135208 RepID=A0A4Y9ZUW8_9AGAM|nr:hypothetical protein EWM64_g5415 [Hericium alpestre]
MSDSSDDFLSGLRGRLRKGMGLMEPETGYGTSARGSTSRKAAYARFHPEDDLDLYPKAFFSHPDTFKPQKDWLVTDTHIITYVRTGGLLEQMAGNLYHPLLNKTYADYGGTPEQQFVNRLVDVQIEKLSQMDLGDLQQRDFTLKVGMDNIPDKTNNPRIWRRFRVSGGLSIAALSDKVITPLMGWTRNYHGHAFTVSQITLQESTSIDVMHSHQFGYAVVPEKSNRGVWTVAHLLQAEGEEMMWRYDFGDIWDHMITLEEIAPASESTGKVAVLDGAGACPPEDGDGNLRWFFNILKLESDKPGYRSEVISKINNSMNYKDKPVSADFDPDQFDIVEARQRVHAALASPDSVTTGAKQFMVPLHPSALDKPAPGTIFAPKKGQKLERTWDGGQGDGTVDGPRFLQEMTTTKRDKKISGCCWSCGCPHKLSACGRCHKTLYCGKACQKDHWSNGHRQQCKSSKR